VCTDSSVREVVSILKEPVGEKDAWVPPKGDWMKINVDGSFVKQTEQVWIGVIARNCKVEVVFSAWRVLIRCASALEIKL
jgi:hypothetical protein